MKLGGQKGFTLIEVIVVAGIIAVLAGILVPLIFKEIDESKISRAYADVRSISSALIVFRKDTGKWPINANCTGDGTILRGPDGNLPGTGNGVIGWNMGTPYVIDDYLMNDGNQCFGSLWKGPYMASVTKDPWGNSYIINADAFESSGLPVWIISAGPNGTIDTSANSNLIDPNDIGIRLK